MNAKIYAQLENAYKRMATQARYRPAAPNDGMGNITVPLEECVIEAETAEYAASWWKEEDDLRFFVGCCNFRTRVATVLTIEAARAMCGGADDVALDLLRAALAELEDAMGDR